jgi:photosystem II stability/assembly factor-like uncharacterized protein
MPRDLTAALDPGPSDALRSLGRRQAVFLAADGKTTAIRAAKGEIGGPGVVASFEIDDVGWSGGRFLARIDQKAVVDIDPRSLHVFSWDATRQRYELVRAAGANLSHGYVWASVSRPGRYAVAAIPTTIDFDAATISPEWAGALLEIFMRRFIGEGPWRPLGPRHLSCCIYDLAIDPSDSDRIYAAGSDSGVWRLDSVAAYPGQTWVPLTDFQTSLQVNAIAVSPANSHFAYYVDRGGALYRSSTRGTYWSRRGSAPLGNANRLIAHPTSIQSIFVATPSGLWHSETGGSTWLSNPGQTTLLDGDILDVVLDPDDPAILYAAQRSVGVLKSSNEGRDWQTVLPWSRASAPSSTMIKIAVGHQGSDANRTVVAKLAEEVFLNRHGGRTPYVRGGTAWTSLGKVGGHGYGDWCHVVAVDPFDDDIILAGAQEVFRTTTGAASWTKVIGYYAPHEDLHRLMFDPTTEGVVYAATDGGVYRSTDHGATFQTSGDDVAAGRDLNLGLVTAQFYRVGVSGDHAVGDAYHQGMLGAGSLAAEDWEGIEGHAWEFADIYGDPVRDGEYFVFGSPKLFRRRFPTPASGPALVEIGSFTPRSIAVDARPGSNVILVSNDTGSILKATNGDSDSPTWTTMPGLSVGSDVVRSIAFAPSTPQRAYALTGSGRVFVCADADAAGGWVEVTSLPSAPGVALAVSVENDQDIFAITRQTVYRSVTGGASWTAIPGSAPSVLPPGLSLRSVVAGPGSVYIADVTGIFQSPDAGANWFPYDEGLPNAEITQLLWTEHDLFAVTHGRGLWHHGRTDVIRIPPLAHKPDFRWLIELWLAIHGGDPAPDAIRKRFGHGYDRSILREEIRAKEIRR